LAHVSFSIQSGTLEHPKRIQRNPFAGLIPSLEGPGAGDRATQPPSLLVLATQYPLKQRHKAQVTGIAMRDQSFERAE